MKLGIALAGGGARGAYQLGVWKAFIESGLSEKVVAFSGASVGSINAVLFAMDDYERAEQLWLSLEKDTLFHIDKDTFRRLFKERWLFFTKGIYNTETFERMMDETIDMRRLKNKNVFIATTSIGGMRKKFFRVLKANYKFHFSKEKDNLRFHPIAGMTKQKLKKVVLASCAIPVVFRPVVFDNETYYDGGILNNVPYQPLEEFGCDKIIVIDLFRHNFTRKRDLKHENIRIIHPKRSLRGILDFCPDKTKRRFELGYIDGMEFIKNNKEFLEVN